MEIHLKEVKKITEDRIMIKITKLFKILYKMRKKNHMW